MPTKQTMPSRKSRAAATVIISSAVNSAISGAPQAAAVLGKILGAEHMPLHPGRESVAIAGDVVPSLVEPVVARVIALGIGWMRPTRHGNDGAHDPGRQHHRVGRRIETID